MLVFGISSSVDVHFLVRDVLPYLVVLAIGLSLVVLNIYNLGRKMSEPENLISDLATISTDQEQLIHQHSAWLSSVGLQRITQFRFGAGSVRSDVVVFHQEGRPRYITFTMTVAERARLTPALKRLHISIETARDDFKCLDTTSSRDSGLFPCPGMYAQDFPKLELADLWKRHLEGEAYLAKRFQLTWPPVTKPYIERISESMRLRMSYNRKQILWPFRVLFRFFITRHLNANRTVAQRYP
jgi:hypothetical protein